MVGTAISRNLKQTITHWTWTQDGFGGATFSAPVGILGRWENKAISFRDERGDEVTSDAIAYLASDISVGDYLVEGVSTTADPSTVAGARRIRQFHKTPNIRTSAYERKAMM